MMLVRVEGGAWHVLTNPYMRVFGRRRTAGSALTFAPGPGRRKPTNSRFENQLPLTRPPASSSR